ncbi:MAG: YifB family Mg chelatase-like AAA ATPase [Candidatus Paceibacterota bacterium]|jgi:magnesium chelatase family protein
MSFSRVYSAQPHLLKGQIITIEVDISRGLNAFSIVGLPDKAIDEARDRVGSALKNAGFESPKHKNQKTVVSLSPADMKKEGSFFDLAIALGYLLSAENIKFNPEKKIFLGELALNGEIRLIKGVLPIVQEAKMRGFTEIYVPKENTREAALVEGINIYGVGHITDVIDHLSAENMKDGERKSPLAPEKKTTITRSQKTYNDIRDIRGQEHAKRALEIAAAGGHNIALYGPPGTGKTMLARAFAALLPDLDTEEVLEITGIHSVAGSLADGFITEPPFRAPHHTSSYVAMIGGGTFPKPGEVTLAHRGVLFLDEFPEFEKRVLESLRQPLEDNTVSISRAKGSVTFPSNFILVAAMNPCPCGNKGSKQKECTCKSFDIARYERKLSGPIMDRIDMWVNVGAVDYSKLSDQETSGESAETIKSRINAARVIQKERFAKNTTPNGQKTNSDMSAKDISSINLAPEVKKLLNDSAEKLKLSARAYHRVIKLARTIADLTNSSEINSEHILEALQYRPKIN